MTGALTVEAMEANDSPVNAAVVRVYGRTEDTSTSIMRCYTDKNGLSESILLPAPNSIHSTQNSPQVCPYAAYDVHATKGDYDKEVINGVQISPDTTSSLRIIMRCCDGRPPKTNMV